MFSRKLYNHCTRTTSVHILAHMASSSHVHDRAQTHTSKGGKEEGKEGGKKKRKERQETKGEQNEGS